jgi:hypothetical protein
MMGRLIHTSPQRHAEAPRGSQGRRDNLHRVARDHETTASFADLHLDFDGIPNLHSAHGSQDRRHPVARIFRNCRAKIPVRAILPQHPFRGLFDSQFSIRPHHSPMPIEFTIDREHRLILTTASALVNQEVLSDYVQRKAQAGVIDYAELFDARDVTLDLSLSDLQRIADEVRAAQGLLKPGKVAAITNSDFVYGLARAYAALAREDNPHFHIFRDIEEARAWLLEVGLEPLSPRQGAEEMLPQSDG